MKKYGQTWWGKKWLNSLNNISYIYSSSASGRTYATQGAVVDVTLDIGKAAGTVEEKKLYSVKIAFNPLTAQDKKKIIDYLNESPKTLLQLINHEFSRPLFDFLEKNKIKIFPTSWDDFEPRCSCKKYPIVCRHSAALNYVLTEMIDQEPSKLFKLFGLDLTKALDFGSHKEKEQEIKKIDSLQKSEKNLNLSPKKVIPTTFSGTLIEEIIATEPPNKTANAYPSNADSFSIGLKKVPILLPLYDEILEAHPIFHRLDFKQKVITLYTHWKRHAKHISQYKQYAKNTLQTLYSFLMPMMSLYFKKVTSLSLVINNKNQCVNIYINGRAEKKWVESLVTFLDHVSPEEINQYCPAIQTLYFLYNYVLLSFEKSALVPEICQNTDGETFIRWLPTLFNEAVRFNIKKFTQYCPPDLVKIKDKNHKHLHIREDELVKTAFSILINFHLAKHMQLPRKVYKPPADDIHKMFFDNEAVRFDSLSERNIPLLIHLWLDKLHLTSMLKDIFLFVEAEQDYFYLQIKVGSANTYENIFDVLAKKDKAGVLKMLAKIQVLFEYIPELEKLVKKRHEKVAFHYTVFDEIFFKKIPKLQSLGINIMLPKALKKYSSQKLSLV